MPGLEDLYREIILDHYRTPRNRGELPSPPAQRVEGYNPLCGDEVIVYLDLDAGHVKDVKWGGQGCSISQSSASMMSVAIMGKTLDEARDVIRSFKGLMSIHEHRLDADDDGSHDSSDGTDGPDSQGAVEGDDIKLGDLQALQGVVKFPVRIKCATLCWNTLQQGLDEALI